MSVPAIALYAAAAATATSPAPSPGTSASPAPHRPVAGGLSCLFSSGSPSSATAAGRLGGDDLAGDLSGSCGAYSCSYSYSSPPFKCRDQYSPASVFQGPGSGSAVGARSPPRSDWRAGRDRLFNGFVRNALGSCLEYVPPASVGGDGDLVGVSIGELAFTMDESLGDAGEMAVGGESFVKELLAAAQDRHRVFREELVVKAFYEAAKAHSGQKRASGDPYLLHCVETAELLAEIGANATVVSAGLLHDSMDDSFLDYEYIFGLFGAGVADLVEGVSKLSHLSKLARENNTASRTVEADRLHTMFLAMADARAVLIKLADRLHNMRTLAALPLLKQQRFAKETLEIFVPLAHRLGISSWKDQLESICFKHLHPEEHEELSSKLVESLDEVLITSAKEKLEKGLQHAGISFHSVSGRHKSLYSIYSKMLKKNLKMDEILDIHGLRLVVESEEECYRALGVVHKLWPQVDGRLKDYIVNPKSNGYRSLHTVVLSEDVHPFEIQIRTREMHLQAEYGFAAHWRYKEGACRHSFVLQVVEWARWVVTWQCETMNKSDPSPFGSTSGVSRPPCPFPSHATDCPYSYTRQCKHNGPIFVILLEHDRMSVQEIPANSTVADLLARVFIGGSRWSLGGLQLKEDLRPRVNHVPVKDPSQVLNMGDLVELSPSLPGKSLVECREEIQRMYDGGSIAFTGCSTALRRS